MNRSIFRLLTLALHWLSPTYNVLLKLLEFQIQMLRSRINASRIVPTAKEKAEHLRLGALIDHQVRDVMLVIQPPAISDGFG